MRWSWSKNKIMRYAYQFWCEYLNTREHFENMGVIRMSKLNWALKKYSLKTWTGFSLLGLV